MEKEEDNQVVPLREVIKTMKRITFVPMLAVLSLAFATASFAQTAEITQIDAYAKTIDAVTRKRTAPKLVFADVSDYETNENPAWRQFASEKALEKHRKGTEAYAIAHAWRKGGKLVASNFTLFSPSGDWVKYVHHYFREDGSLARVESDYRTFNGDFKVIRRRYFDSDGKLITESAKFLDLETGKPKDASSGVMGDDANEVDYYKTTNRLPYAHLLKLPK